MLSTLHGRRYDERPGASDFTASIRRENKKFLFENQCKSPKISLARIVFNFEKAGLMDAAVAEETIEKLLKLLHSIKEGHEHKNKMFQEERRRHEVFCSYSGPFYIKRK